MNPSKNPYLKEVLHTFTQVDRTFKGKGSSSFSDYQSFLRSVVSTARDVAYGSRSSISIKDRFEGPYGDELFTSSGVCSELYAIRNRVSKREELLEAMHDFITIVERREQEIKAWYDLENEHKLASV